MSSSIRLVVPLLIGAALFACGLVVGRHPSSGRRVVEVVPCQKRGVPDTLRDPPTTFSGPAFCATALEAFVERHREVQIEQIVPLTWPSPLNGYAAELKLADGGRLVPQDGTKELLVIYRQ